MRSLLVSLILLWPCVASAVSPVPTEIFAEVDHGLRQATVLADPDGYRGRTLLLGGVVERTVSEPGDVRIEISCLTLTDDDRPDRPEPALGRVLITAANLDGAMLQPGRFLTVVGVVAGRAAGKSGSLPLLLPRFVYPWPTAEEEAVREAAERYYRGYAPWCAPWYADPWCDPWYYGPYQRWRFGAGYYRHWH